MLSILINLLLDVAEYSVNLMQVDCCLHYGKFRKMFPQIYLIQHKQGNTLPLAYDESHC